MRQHRLAAQVVVAVDDDAFGGEGEVGLAGQGAAAVLDSQERGLLTLRVVLDGRGGEVPDRVGVGLGVKRDLRFLQHDGRARHRRARVGLQCDHDQQPHHESEHQQRDARHGPNLPAGCAEKRDGRVQEPFSRSEPRPPCRWRRREPARCRRRASRPGSGREGTRPRRGSRRCRLRACRPDGTPRADHRGARA